jgi:cysteinyl-tRNA synthetase
MLRLYNSLSRRIEDFKPLKGKTVTMYNCGPTVYDFAHIGNLRTYLFADILRRYLEHSGYKVRQVMNITDVGHTLSDADTGEDKIDAVAKREQLDPLAVARKYEEKFREDIGRLNLLPAYKNPRATEHVEEMKTIIAKLLKKGMAYEAGGDIYFDVAKFPKYGLLSGNTIDKLKSGARVEVNGKKRSPHDFALWISNPNHLLQWESAWGKGYPGWHIECSAMAMKYLGATIDIHTGGEDNKFPHHECEIAQSEGATEKTFARFWLHASHLLVDGAKMSKSLNNFYKLDDLIAKGYEPRAVRYALIASHYRDQQNFAFASLDAAKSAVAKLENLFERLVEKGDRPLFQSDKGSVPFKTIVDTFERDFNEAMDDDLNVPKALGHLFVFVREMNAALDEGIGASERKKALVSFKAAVGGVLGLELKTAERVAEPDGIKALLIIRENARKAKDYAAADKARTEIEKLGYRIEDTLNGSRVVKK